MKVLVTGICGFVGSTLTKALKESFPNYEIFGIDNLARNGSWIHLESLRSLGIRVFHSDLRLSSDIESLPKADWVIDAAANASVLAGVDGKTTSRQLVENNLLGTVNILEYCKRNNSGFILLSTSRVYSIPGLVNLRMDVDNEAFVPCINQNFPIGITAKGVNESYSTLPPVSLYGSTKVSSEHLALEYGQTFQFPVWINRCGVMAGPGQFGHPGQGIFAYWIHSFREKRPLKYIGFNGSGFQVRDCLHPRDLLSLVSRQLAEPFSSVQPRILNVSGGIENACSLRQLTSWCEQRFGKTSKVESTKSVRPFDIPWMVLDSQLSNDAWEWAPTTNLNRILDEIATFAEANDGWCKISEVG